MDIATKFDTKTLTGDLSLTARGLAEDDGIETAVVLSLFTDRLAEPDDELPFGDDRRGWWGDAIPVRAEQPGDRIGSRLWLLARAKATQEILLRAQEYASEALAWLIEDGVVETVEVEAEWQGPTDSQARLALRVTIHLVGGTAFARAFELNVGGG